MVLERDPRNVKAYFRRAEAHELLENFSKAHDDFLSAFKLDPSDKSIQSRLTRLERKMGILPSVSLHIKLNFSSSASYFTHVEEPQC